MTPEQKKMIGNNDGFTYGYGRANEYSTTSRHKESKARCKRADKRAVKRKEDKRFFSED